MESLRRYFKPAAIGLGVLIGGAVALDGIVITGPDEVKMVLTTGDPSGFAPQGFSLKMPVLQTTFDAVTSLEEYHIPQSSVALQNGTITAEGIQSAAFIQFNGSREEKEQTITLIRERMPDFEARITSLAEAALRDTVRQTYIASSSDSEEEQSVTNRPGAIDFLDTERVGEEVKRELQESISAIIPGTVVMPGTGETRPRLEIVEYRIGNFEFDGDYMARRQKIAAARANAEAARFEEAEALRQANAAAARAEGEKRAEVLRGEGEAQRILLQRNAEAEGLRNLVEAAGGPEALREQTLAERWNGQTPQVVGGDGVIVDGRFAPGADITAPVAGQQRAPGR